MSRSSPRTSKRSTLLAGLKFNERFFFEIKGGIADSPDLKVGVGYTFRK